MIDIPRGYFQTKEGVAISLWYTKFNKSFLDYNLWRMIRRGNLERGVDRPHWWRRDQQTFALTDQGRERLVEHRAGKIEAKNLRDLFSNRLLERTAAVLRDNDLSPGMRNITLHDFLSGGTQ
jgi:DNA-binding PadR family transcriptional regulator